MRRWSAALLLCAASAAHTQFRERINVVRILLDVRVTDASGKPIGDLTPADFDVKIGGKPAEVESVEWIDDVSGAAGSQSAEDVGQAESRPLREGRVLVFFVQTDLARNSFRLGGQMSFFRYADKIIDTFAPGDRIAVLQFDSHLKLRLDFTTDKEEVRATLRDTLSTGTPPQPPLVPEPSLASRLDRADMKRAADSETGLLVLGNALRSIDGAKTILLLGWGLGRRSGSSVQMTKNYGHALEALDAARATIFAIDVPQADYHDLQIGLQQAAADTGGLYVKTFRFPQIAVDRLQRALAGHYEIELRRPTELDAGTHRLIVNVKRRGAIVLAPSTYTDRH
jgi:VWFA-related protein